MWDPPLSLDPDPLVPDSHLGPSVAAGPRFPSGSICLTIPIVIHRRIRKGFRTPGPARKGFRAERIPNRWSQIPIWDPPSTIPIVIRRRIRKGFRVLHRGDSHQAKPELSGPPIGKRTRLRSSRAGSRSYLCRRGRESDGVAAQGIEAIIILGVLDGHGRAGALAIEGGRGKQHRRHGLLEV